MMKSDVFGWQYELDASAPVITTQAEIFTTADAYNQTVGIELVGGKMMIIDMMNHKQVATMGGAVEEWARANYPTEEVIASNSDLVQEMKAEMSLHIDDVKAGIPLDRSMAMRKTTSGLQARENVPRAFCACPVLPISCLVIGCKGICLLFACTGGTA
jgi:hypothetical protein